jgi:protocatechuate 3,4-dioxygenase beta subunit
MSNILNSTFNVVGATISSTWQGIFDAVIDNGENDIVKLNIGKGRSVNIDKLNQYTLTPVIGTITENVNGEEIPIPNVRVSFIKDFVVINNTQLNYNGNKTVVDYDMTDEDGEYVVFIEPGTYTIRIDGGKYAEYFTNQVITEGLKNEFYVTIDGLIQHKCEDIIELCNFEEKIVTGFMIDQNEKPLANAEIIITKDKEIITYCKTDNDGKYQFAIKEGIYNIRLRGPKQSVKIMYDYDFRADSGQGMFVASPITTGEYF